MNAVLRRHHGEDVDNREDVDIALEPEVVLSLARGSLAGISRADQRLLTRKLGAREVLPSAPLTRSSSRAGKRGSKRRS